VFSEQDQATKPPVVQQQAAPNAYEDLLKGIKNEHGLPKYATLDDALNALKHSQEYIPQVKSQLSEKDAELAQLRAQLAQSAQLEEVVSRLTKPTQSNTMDDHPSGSGLDESAVMKLVQQQLANNQAQQNAYQNQQQVETALKAKYGDKTVDVIKQRAAELGLTPQALGELSSKSPQAVLALFNTQGPSGPKPTTSSINTSSFRNDVPPLERPTKSLLTGASSRDQTAYLLKIREEVYRKNGIDQ
jgi:myosin heavy subunit